MGYVIREIYALGGHTVCSPSGHPMIFQNQNDAEKTANVMNKSKKDVTRLFVVVQNHG